MSIPEVVFADASPTPQPFVRIIEQPCKSLRFRYRVEGRPGLILGVSSTPDNKVPFSILISGYTGKVRIVVSCVTKDEPHKPHPNLLMGQHCKNGYYFHETTISPLNPVVTFPKMALQCVKRNQVAEELQNRESQRVDPFITGFAHKNDARSIDLNVVRLAIQVFLVNTKDIGILNPIISNPIFNKKLNPDPKIYRLSHCTSPVKGGDTDIILLCTKISKDDIEIKFYEMEGDRIVWKDYGSFHSKDVYNNSSICFKPPSYRRINIPETVDVFVQLVRPSDGAESASHKFQYLPLPSAKPKNPNPLFEQLVGSTKSTNLLMELGNEIFQPLNVPITQPNENLLPSGASWMLLPTPDADSKQDFPAWMVPPQTENTINENISNLAQSWMVPQASQAPKKASLPDLNLPLMVPPASVNKKYSVPDWMTLQGPEEVSQRVNLPAFAQLLDRPHQTSRPIKVPRLDNAPLLVDSTPWAQQVPLSINNINKTESRRSTQGDMNSWNIQEDFVGTDANIDSASGISRILDMDYNHIHLEAFNINSGDLEMTDVKQLSGSLQDHLVLMD